MLKKRVLNSPRLSELRLKKRRTFRNRTILASVFAVTLLIGFSFLLKWEKITIDNIEITGNKVIETGEILKIVEDEISGNKLFFFQKNNFLLFPKRKIKKSLALEFQRLKDISINVNNFKTLEVTVAEREAKYIWCGDDISMYNVGAEENKCYFTDEAGYVFDNAPYFSDDVYFKLYGVISRSSDEPIGLSFLPEAFSQYIFLKENMEMMGLKPSSLLVKADGNAEIYLSNNSSQELPKVIFKTDADFNKLSENLQAILSTEPLKTELIEKYSLLSYIDLRFGNKVYYKFR